MTTRAAIDNQVAVDARTEIRHLDDKTWSTYVARAALCGLILARTTDDRGQPVYYASAFSMTRRLETEGEVDAFIRRVAGPNG